ncbi:unnamed protein product [Amoebophrya sp. A120]|nr:unnamed protein product [Amoebophrya sp. A120]|eukprot:GSA120T00001989001.1
MGFLGKFLRRSASSQSTKKDSDRVPKLEASFVAPYDASPARAAPQAAGTTTSSRPGPRSAAEGEQATSARTAEDLSFVIEHAPARTTVAINAAAGGKNLKAGKRAGFQNSRSSLVSSEAVGSTTETSPFTPGSGSPRTLDDINSQQDNSTTRDHRTSNGERSSGSATGGGGSQKRHLFAGARGTSASGSSLPSEGAASSSKPRRPDQEFKFRYALNKKKVIEKSRQEAGKILLTQAGMDPSRETYDNLDRIVRRVDPPNDIIVRHKRATQTAGQEEGAGAPTSSPPSNTRQHHLHGGQAGGAHGKAVGAGGSRSGSKRSAVTDESSEYAVSFEESDNYSDATLWDQAVVFCERVRSGRSEKLWSDELSLTLQRLLEEDRSAEECENELLATHVELLRNLVLSSAKASRSATALDVVVHKLAVDSVEPEEVHSTRFAEALGDHPFFETAQGVLGIGVSGSSPSSVKVLLAVVGTLDVVASARGRLAQYHTSTSEKAAQQAAVQQNTKAVETKAASPPLSLAPAQYLLGALGGVMGSSTAVVSSPPPQHQGPSAAGSGTKGAGGSSSSKQRPASPDGSATRPVVRPPGVNIFQNPYSSIIRLSSGSPKGSPLGSSPSPSEGMNQTLLQQLQLEGLHSMINSSSNSCSATNPSPSPGAGSNSGGPVAPIGNNLFGGSSKRSLLSSSKKSCLSVDSPANISTTDHGNVQAGDGSSSNGPGNGHLHLVEHSSSVNATALSASSAALEHGAPSHLLQMPTDDWNSEVSRLGEKVRESLSLLSHNNSIAKAVDRLNESKESHHSARSGVQHPGDVTIENPELLATEQHVPTTYGESVEPTPDLNAGEDVVATETAAPGAFEPTGRSSSLSASRASNAAAKSAPVRAPAVSSGAVGAARSPGPGVSSSSGGFMSPPLPWRVGLNASGVTSATSAGGAQWMRAPLNAVSPILPLDAARSPLRPSPLRPGVPVAVPAVQNHSACSGEEHSFSSSASSSCTQLDLLPGALGGTRATHARKRSASREDTKPLQNGSPTLSEMREPPPATPFDDDGASCPAEEAPQEPSEDMLENALAAESKAKHAPQLQWPNLAVDEPAAVAAGIESNVKALIGLHSNDAGAVADAQTGGPRSMDHGADTTRSKACLEKILRDYAAAVAKPAPAVIREILRVFQIEWLVHHALEEYQDAPVAAGPPAGSFSSVQSSGRGKKHHGAPPVVKPTRIFVEYEQDMSPGTRQKHEKANEYYYQAQRAALVKRREGSGSPSSFRTEHALKAYVRDRVRQGEPIDKAVAEQMPEFTSPTKLLHDLDVPSPLKKHDQGGTFAKTTAPAVLEADDVVAMASPEEPTGEDALTGLLVGDDGGAPELQQEEILEKNTLSELLMKNTLSSDQYPVLSKKYDTIECNQFLYDEAALLTYKRLAGGRNGSAGSRTGLNELDLAGSRTGLNELDLERDSSDENGTTGQQLQELVQAEDGTLLLQAIKISSGENMPHPFESTPSLVKDHYPELESNYKSLTRDHEYECYDQDALLTYNRLKGGLASFQNYGGSGGSSRTGLNELGIFANIEEDSKEEQSESEVRAVYPEMMSVEDASSSAANEVDSSSSATEENNSKSSYFAVFPEQMSAAEDEDIQASPPLSSSGVATHVVQAAASPESGGRKKHSPNSDREVSFEISPPAELKVTFRNEDEITFAEGRSPEDEDVDDVMIKGTAAGVEKNTTSTQQQQQGDVEVPPQPMELEERQKSSESDLVLLRQQGRGTLAGSSAVAATGPFLYSADPRPAASSQSEAEVFEDATPEVVDDLLVRLEEVNQKADLETLAKSTSNLMKSTTSSRASPNLVVQPQRKSKKIVSPPFVTNEGKVYHAHSTHHNVFSPEHDLERCIVNDYVSRASSPESPAYPGVAPLPAEEEGTRKISRGGTSGFFDYSPKRRPRTSSDLSAAGEKMGATTDPPYIPGASMMHVSQPRSTEYWTNEKAKQPRSVDSRKNSPSEVVLDHTQWTLYHKGSVLPEDQAHVRRSQVQSGADVGPKSQPSVTTSSRKKSPSNLRSSAASASASATEEPRDSSARKKKRDRSSDDKSSSTTPAARQPPPGKKAKASPAKKDERSSSDVVVSKSKANKPEAPAAKKGGEQASGRKSSPPKSKTPSPEKRRSSSDQLAKSASAKVAEKTTPPRTKEAASKKVAAPKTKAASKAPNQGGTRASAATQEPTGSSSRSRSGSRAKVTIDAGDSKNDNKKTPSPTKNAGRGGKKASPNKTATVISAPSQRSATQPLQQRRTGGSSSSASATASVSESRRTCDIILGQHIPDQVDFALTRFFEEYPMPFLQITKLNQNWYFVMDISTGARAQGKKIYADFRGQQVIIKSSRGLESLENFFSVLKFKHETDFRGTWPEAKAEQHEYGARLSPEQRSLSPNSPTGKRYNESMSILLQHNPSATVSPMSPNRSKSSTGFAMPASSSTSSQLRQLHPVAARTDDKDAESSYVGNELFQRMSSGNIVQQSASASSSASRSGGRKNKPGGGSSTQGAGPSVVVVDRDRDTAGGQNPQEFGRFPQLESEKGVTEVIQKLGNKKPRTPTSASNPQDQLLADPGAGAARERGFSANSYGAADSMSYSRSSNNASGTFDNPEYQSRPEQFVFRESQALQAPAEVELPPSHTMSGASSNGGPQMEYMFAPGTRPVAQSLHREVDALYNVDDPVVVDGQLHGLAMLPMAFVDAEEENLAKNESALHPSPEKNKSPGKQKQKQKKAGVSENALKSAVAASRGVQLFYADSSGSSKGSRENNKSSPEKNRNYYAVPPSPYGQQRLRQAEDDQQRNGPPAGAARTADSSASVGNNKDEGGHGSGSSSRRNSHDKYDSQTASSSRRNSYTAAYYARKRASTEPQSGSQYNHDLPPHAHTQSSSSSASRSLSARNSLVDKTSPFCANRNFGGSMVFSTDPCIGDWAKPPPAPAAPASNSNSVSLSTSQRGKPHSARSSRKGGSSSQKDLETQKLAQRLEEEVLQRQKLQQELAILREQQRSGQEGKHSTRPPRGSSVGKKDPKFSPEQEKMIVQELLYGNPRRGRELQQPQSLQAAVPRIEQPARARISREEWEAIAASEQHRPIASEKLSLSPKADFRGRVNSPGEMFRDINGQGALRKSAAPKRSPSPAGTLKNFPFRIQNTGTFKHQIIPQSPSPGAGPGGLSTGSLIALSPHDGQGSSSTQQHLHRRFQADDNAFSDTINQAMKEAARKALTYHKDFQTGRPSSPEEAHATRMLGIAGSSKNTNDFLDHDSYEKSLTTQVYRQYCEVRQRPEDAPQLQAAIGHGRASVGEEARYRVRRSQNRFEKHDAARFPGHHVALSGSMQSTGVDPRRGSLQVSENPSTTYMADQPPQYLSVGTEPLPFYTDYYSSQNVVAGPHQHHAPYFQHHNMPFLEQQQRGR